MKVVEARAVGGKVVAVMAVGLAEEAREGAMAEAAATEVAATEVAATAVAATVAVVRVVGAKARGA